MNVRAASSHRPSTAVTPDDGEVVAVGGIGQRLTPLGVALDRTRGAPVDLASEVERDQVGGGLCLPAAQDLSADVDAERGHDHQHDERQRDNRQHCAAIIPSAAHQLFTSAVLDETNVEGIAAETMGTSGINGWCS